MSTSDIILNVIIVIITVLIMALIGFFNSNKKPKKQDGLKLVINRKEAQKTLLEWVDNEIKDRGEDAIYCCAPCIGKNKWTLKEYRNAVVNDTPMEGCKNNPIDDYINLLKWKQEND